MILKRITANDTIRKIKVTINHGQLWLVNGSQLSQTFESVEIVF